MRLRSVTFLLTAGVAMCLLGCAQTTTAPQVQTPRNESSTAQESDQRSAGSQTYIYVINRPGPGVESESKTSVGGGAATRTSKVTNGQAGPDGAGLGDADATYQIAGLSINVNYGNTAATATPTGGAASGVVNPAQSGNVSPHQEPKASVNVPIAVGLPGSAPQATGASSLEGPASTTATNQNDLKTLWDQAKNGDPAAKQKLLEILLGKPTASQPVP